MTVYPKYITNVAFDNRIPFVKEFVIPYILLFPYIAYGIIYTGMHSKKNYYKLIVFLAGSMALSCAIYAMFPNGQTLRPVVKGNDVFSVLVRFIYASDTPTDVCPSMHVIDAIAVNTALFNTDAFSKHRCLKALSFVTMIFMCLSTVLIKQHAIFDVFCGLITAAVFYFALYLLPIHKIHHEPGTIFDPLTSKSKIEAQLASKQHKL